MKPEEKEKALKWLNEKWKDKKCECCNQHKWQLQDDFFTLIPVENQSLVLGERNMPYYFVIMCINCGNTKSFNAVMSKVIVDNSSTTLNT